jgi:hypothetical protein
VAAPLAVSWLSETRNQGINFSIMQTLIVQTLTPFAACQSRTTRSTGLSAVDII